MHETVVAPAAPVAQTPVAQTPVPAPVHTEALRTFRAAPTARPVAQRSLRVGAVDDPLENEADRVADRVMRNLTEVPTSDGADRNAHITGVATPGTTRIRRAFSPVSQTAVDAPPDSKPNLVRDAGAVAPWGSDRVQRSPFNNRGPSPTTRTQTQFAAPPVSARPSAHGAAFSPAGTPFQIAQIQRSSLMVQRLFGKKRPKPAPAPQAEVSGPMNMPNAEETAKRLAAMGYKPARVSPAGMAPRPAGAGAPPPPPPPPPPAGGFKGHAGKGTTAAVEAGKPAFAVGVAGASGAADALAGGGAASAGGAGALGLGLVVAADAAYGLYNASAMKAEGAAYDDDAMIKAGNRKQGDQGAALAGGLVGTAKGAAVVSQAALHSAGAAGNAASASAAVTAGAAAGVLGVVGGSAMVIQGAWRGGKAMQKLCRLTWGRGQQMLSAAGERWKKVIVGAEKFKLAINALKIACGVLAIAAGALFIVGSPVGWAVGLAAAIAAGIYAGAKIAGKISNARDKSAARDQLAAEAAKPKISGPTGVEINGQGASQGLAGMGYDMSKMQPAGQAPQPPAPDRGQGMKPIGPQQELPEDAAARQDAIDKAHAVARGGSANAQMASEMIEAMSRGNGVVVQDALDAIVKDPQAVLAELITNPDDCELHDAFQLLSSINVDPDEALAPSGQVLIEQKLSKAEAM